jgi:putative nucleotidyltransferase with HDIG domain
MTTDSPKTTAREIVARLQHAGFAAFWVGGCVRDFLLGCEPQDFDIATDAKPEQVEKLFKKTIPVGKKFGVIIVVECGQQFQVATFRAEADYQDGRRPEKVIFANAEADALRRDFTVNGLFCDPLTEKIHDWVGGEKDLRAKIIRTIGAPEERFGEDHLRLLRAVRFAAQLGFEIEPKTFAAIQKLAPKIKLISAERIRDELIKLFAMPTADFSLSSTKGGEGRGEEANNSKNKIPSPQPSPRLGGAREKTGGAASPLPTIHLQTDAGAHGVTHPTSSAARGLVLLRESGLLEQILPELAATIDCEQSPDFHPEGSVFNHICLMLEKMPAQPSLKSSFGAASVSELLPWAILLHDIAKPVTAEHDAATGKIHFYGHEKVGADMAENILQRLRFPKKQTEEIVAAVRHHMQFKDVKEMRKATLRRLLLRETFPLELELHRLDCLGSFGGLELYDFLIQQAEQLKRKPEIKPSLLTGKDLIALGMKPGPAMGKLLDEIREKQLADELKNSRQAKAWVKRMLAK